MSTKIVLDKGLFLRVRRGIIFYYFGDGCLADYNMTSIAYLDKTEVAIIKLVDGLQKIDNIIQSIRQTAKTAFLNEGQILNIVQRLLAKGILIARRESKKFLPDFHGQMGKYFPKEIIVELTNVCNFYCPFCYKNADSKGSFIKDNTIACLDEIIRGNVGNIMFTGGEPTIHPSFFRYVDIFSKYAKISMVTNGSELYKYDTSELEHFKMIQFSLYGCNDEEYKKMTGNEKGFTRLKQSVELIKRRNIPFALAVTFSKATMERIEDYILAAIALNAEVLLVGVTDPFGREKETFFLNSDYIKMKKHFVEKLTFYKKKYQDKITIILNNIHVEEKRDAELKTKVYHKCLQCGSGIDSLVISQDGRVRPCPYLPEKEFDMGGMDELRMHIEGSFQKEKLCHAIQEYYNTEQFIQKGIVPCHALQEYVDEYLIKSQEEQGRGMII